VSSTKYARLAVALSAPRRCVQLLWSHGQENPAAWAEAVNKIKEGILFSFDAAVGQREDEVRRSENQRQMPGWNFCTFFILKVNTALTHPPAHTRVPLTLRSRKASRPPSKA
jgi:hypothetical protein